MPGTGPGQFYLPHGIAVGADGRVYVCDRENDRIQIFSPEGEYLSEWTDTQRPTHLVFDAKGRAFVSELWWHSGQTSRRHGAIAQARPGKPRTGFHRCSVEVLSARALSMACTSASIHDW